MSLPTMLFMGYGLVAEKGHNFFFAVRKHQRLEIFGPNCKKRGPMMGDISGVLNVPDIKFIINGARPHSPKPTFSPC